MAHRWYFVRCQSGQEDSIRKQVELRVKMAGLQDIVPQVRKVYGWALDIVRRPIGVKGFVVLPRRWVVERTFGWLGRYRRLARDYEHTVVSSEAMTYLASVRRMLRLATATHERI